MTEIKDTNLHFHSELDDLERKVLSMVDRAEQMIGMAVEAVWRPEEERTGSILDIAYFRPRRDRAGEEGSG